MEKIRLILMFCTTFIIASSCLNRQFIDGNVEIVSSSDTTLNDSSLVFGHVYHVDWYDKEYYHENELTIWIENSDLETTNDTTGYYSLKIAPGTYTIKCQSTYNEWERLIEEVKNIDLVKNTKTEINFHIGTTIE
jgi:hypothetical protein